MSGGSFVVQPRSWHEIETIADRLRDQLNLAKAPYFPVVDVMEQVLDLTLGIVRFEVASHKEMDGAEGYTDPAGEFIMIREDVYETACQGNGRARFTLAHELGHLVLHARMPLARATKGASLAPFRLSEPQANVFAAALLMPARFFMVNDTRQVVSKRFGTSLEAARRRIETLKKEGRLPTA